MGHEVDAHDVLVHDLGALGLGQEEVHEEGHLDEEVEGDGGDQDVCDALDDLRIMHMEERRCKCKTDEEDFQDHSP